MIVYLVTRRHRYTVNHRDTGEPFWTTWPVPLRDRLRTRFSLVPYEALEDPDRLPRATYVFSDLDRLSGDTRRLAEEAHRRLTGLDDPPPVLNDPHRAIGRADLLDLLRRIGINEHACHRVSERRSPDRFPVFLRDDGHAGTLTPLLQDQRALDRAVARLSISRRGLRGLLMVEFCDVSDPSGEYRKYGAFLVGSRIVSKHVYVSRGWCVRRHELSSPEHVREERGYQRTNPHRAELLDIFRAAGISFGRIDYGVQDGRIRVWEINTNPMLLMPKDTDLPERLANRRTFCEDMTRAFESIDTPGTEHGPPIPGVRFPAPTFRERVAAIPLARPVYRGVRWLATGAWRGIAVLAAGPVRAVRDRATRGVRP